LKQHLSVITLSSRDIPKARRFYERLGWKPGHHDREVAFFQMQGSVLALFERRAFAKDAKIPHSTVKAGGVTLAQNLPSKRAVDAAMALAKKAGAKIVKKAGDTFWGGYSGYFEDLDGHHWELAWNPFWKLDAKGRVTMK
jgi:predicted lactoylglutathione lyase